MEPAKATVIPRIRWVINATVTNVEEHFVPVYLGGVGDNAKFEDRSRGWFVYLQGSHEALHVGMEKPNLEKGDKVRITLEKINA